ncbi:MAG: putative quinol monooxygenase [Planctomycetota bacterium]
MFIVTVEFEVDPSHVFAFRNAMKKQASDSLTLEPSCHQFDVCFDPENESRCFLYERYSDRSAFNAHLASDHFQRFDQTVSAWITKKTVQLWTMHEDVAE